ncbi:MAG: hypothetical protein WCC00_00635 [Candidatus Aminicenantales bacterium]
MDRLPVEHVVSVRIDDGEFKYAKHMECFCVYPGDTIKWVLRNKFPYFVIIKTLVSPFDLSCKITGAGEEIKAKVPRGAAPGIYAYAIGTHDGEKLLIDDPEIIIKPPKGGRD